MSKFYCIIKRLLEVWTTLISEIQYAVNSVSNIISWEEVQCWWQKNQDSFWKAYKKLRLLLLAIKILLSTNHPLFCSTKVTFFNSGYSSCPCHQGKRTYFLTINLSVRKIYIYFGLKFYTGCPWQERYSEDWYF